MPSPPVLVVGSLNIDYIASVSRFPAAGETVAASGLIQRFGGKGANQAIAAARQGARVSMLGCVGDDDQGRAYRDRLRRERINAAGVSAARNALTGTALIAVDAQGENIIIVAPGANGQLTPSAVRERVNLIRAARFVLLQFEIPMETIMETLRLAHRAAVPVILNPSPWRGSLPELPLDTLIVNTLEARAIFGLRAGSFSKTIVRSIQQNLRTRKVTHLIVTRGAQSTLGIGVDDYFEVPALPVRPVDTVGAGDAFAGAYAAARAEGSDVRAAVRLANCAGALATLKRGAQESMPSRSETTRASRSLR